MKLVFEAQAYFVVLSKLWGVLRIIQSATWTTAFANEEEIVEILYILRRWRVAMANVILS